MGYGYRKPNNRLHSYRHAARPNPLIDPGMFSYQPPPGFLGFRAFFPASFFFLFDLSSRGPKNRVFFISF